jgi:hypothetical protein
MLSSARSNAMKILVVDDHSLITDALSILFLDLDPTAEVITTRTADPALPCWKRWSRRRPR